MTREGIKKHLTEFQAWLDGAEIEFKGLSSGKWVLDKDPTWSLGLEYRVKPFEPKQGDSILASKDGLYWHKEVFVQKIQNGKYLTISRRGYKWDVDLETMMVNTTVWEYAKPLNN